MTPASVDGDCFAAAAAAAASFAYFRLVTSSDFTGSASHVFYYWSCVGIVVLGRRHCWCRFAGFRNSANGSDYFKHGVGPSECLIDYYSSTFSIIKNI